MNSKIWTQFKWRQNTIIILLGEVDQQVVIFTLYWGYTCSVNTSIEISEYRTGLCSVVWLCVVVPPVCIHPHVQWPILTEGETPLGPVHLHGGAACVKENSIHTAWPEAQLSQQGSQLTEAPQQRLHPATGGRRGPLIRLSNVKTGQGTRQADIASTHVEYTGQNTHILKRDCWLSMSHLCVILVNSYTVVQDHC